MELTFLDLVGGVLAANLATFGFVVACIRAERKPGFDQPWVVWAGMMLPLLFVAAVFYLNG